MNTIIINNSDENLQNAANIIKNSGIIAFPTETVYGIGADIFNQIAVKNIFQIKNRPHNKPLSAHISDINMVNMLSDIIPDIFYELAHIFLPGPLTLIIKAKDNIPNIVNNSTNSIAIRFPDNVLCKNFINTCGVPLAATSANISGNNSAINPNQVLNELDGKIDAIIDGGECDLKIESTIINLIGTPNIIRVGAIPIDEIEGKIGIKFSHNF
jgi:L-threonylcarbamoyladenylate synthase